MKKVLIALLIIAFLAASAWFFITGFMARQNSAPNADEHEETITETVDPLVDPAPAEEQVSSEQSVSSLPPSEPAATPVPTPEPTPFTGLKVEDNSNFELEEDVDYVFH